MASADAMPRRSPRVAAPTSRGRRARRAASGFAAVAALGVAVLALGFWNRARILRPASSARSARSGAEAAHAQAAALVGASRAARRGLPRRSKMLAGAIEYAGEDSERRSRHCRR